MVLRGSMIKNIKDYIKNGMSAGFDVPKAKDGLASPSASLFFAYTSFIIACGAITYFIYKGDQLSSSVTAIGFWALAMVFYKIKDLDKVNIDVKEGRVELEDDNADNETNK